MAQETKVKITNLKFEKTPEMVEQWLNENQEVNSADFSSIYLECDEPGYSVDFTDIICCNTTLKRIVIDASCLGEGFRQNILRLIKTNTSLTNVCLTGDGFLKSTWEGEGYNSRQIYNISPEMLDALNQNYTLTGIYFKELRNSSDLKNLHQLDWLLERNRQFEKNLSQSVDNKVITLEAIPLTVESLQYFFIRMGRTQRTILFLNVKACVFVDEAAFDVMLNYMRENPQLYGVNFCGSRIGNERARLNIPKLCNVLSVHPGILEVNLANTLCDDTGAKAIAEVLKNKNGKIAFLNLSSNQNIQGEGMDDIASAIGTASHLVELDLSRCPISADKVQVFANTLRLNRSITTLKIGFRDASDETLIQFLHALRPPVTGTGNAKKKREDVEKQHPPFIFNLELKRICWVNPRSSYEPPSHWSMVDFTDNKNQKVLTHYNKELKGAKDNLIAAVVSGNKDDVIKWLQYASIHSLNDEMRESLLHTAVRKGHTKIVELLLENKINTKLRDKNYKTALDLARELNKPDLVALIENREKAVAAAQAQQQQHFKSPAAETTTEKKSQGIKQLQPPTEQPPAPPSAVKKAKITSNPQVGEFELNAEQVEDMELLHERRDDLLQLLVVKLFANFSNQMLYKTLLLEIWDLIKTQPDVVNQKIACQGRVFGNALECAISFGHYKLMKIILHSPHANPNAVLRLACEKASIPLIIRLLIDVRVRNAEVQSLLNLPTIRAEVKVLLQNKLNSPDVSRCGITWVKEFSLVYGSQQGKPLNIQSDSAHTELVLNNNFSRKRLCDPEFDSEKEKIINYDGNPVTASLTFIISVPGWMHGEGMSRRSFTLLLDFVDQHHVTSINEEQRVERIQHRIQSAPAVFFHAGEGAEKKVAEVKAFYETQKESGDPNFQQKFHHGEQALLDYLEQEETVNMIVRRLLDNPEFPKGAKVLQVLLNIHSPRYVCGNCEIGILGEQNAQQSHFLNKLSQQLVMAGCRIPQLSPIRMLAQVSAYLPCSDVQDSDAPKKVVLDLRGCNNHVILAKDLSKTEVRATQFESNMRNF